MSLSDCVPFPTPGAPTKIIRAARRNFRVAVAKVMVIAAHGRMKGVRWEYGRLARQLLLSAHCES
jgi:hypothetical protein